MRRMRNNNLEIRIYVWTSENQSLTLLKILSLLWLLLSLWTEQILLFDYPNETPSWPHNLFQVDPFNS